MKKLLEKIKETKEMKQDFLIMRAKLDKINEIADEYRKGENGYTCMTKVTNIVKGW